MASGVVAGAIAFAGVLANIYINQRHPILEQSQVDVNYEGIAARATRRADLLQEQCDILREWQREAMPILARCADHNPNLRPKIDKMLDINRRANKKAKEAAEAKTQLDAEVAGEGDYTNGV